MRVRKAVVPSFFLCLSTLPFLRCSLALAKHFSAHALPRPIFGSLQLQLSCASHLKQYESTMAYQSNVPSLYRQYEARQILNLPVAQPGLSLEAFQGQRDRMARLMTSEIEYVRAYGSFTPEWRNWKVDYWTWNALGKCQNLLHCNTS